MRWPGWCVGQIWGSRSLWETTSACYCGVELTCRGRGEGSRKWSSHDEVSSKDIVVRWQLESEASNKWKLLLRWECKMRVRLCRVLVWKVWHVGKPLFECVRWTCMEVYSWFTIRGEEYSMMMWRVEGLQSILVGCVDCMLDCGWPVWDCSDCMDSLMWSGVEWRGHYDSHFVFSLCSSVFLGFCDLVLSPLFKL